LLSDFAVAKAPSVINRSEQARRRGESDVEKRILAAI
jgi:hypothetical protein